MGEKVKPAVFYVGRFLFWSVATSGGLLALALGYQAWAFPGEPLVVPLAHAVAQGFAVGLIATVLTARAFARVETRPMGRAEAWGFALLFTCVAALVVVAIIGVVALVNADFAESLAWPPAYTHSVLLVGAGVLAVLVVGVIRLLLWAGTRDRAPRNSRG